MSDFNSECPDCDALMKRLAALERAIWHNMVDSDAGGTPEELVERFVRIWTPQEQGE